MDENLLWIRNKKVFQINTVIQNIGYNVLGYDKLVKQLICRPILIREKFS